MTAFIKLMFMCATTRGLLASTQVTMSGYVLFTRQMFLINGTFQDTTTRSISQCASLCSRQYNGCEGFLVPDSRCGNNTATTAGNCQLVSITDETMVYPRLGSDCKLLYADIHLMEVVITGNLPTVTVVYLIVAFRTVVRGYMTIVSTVH
jgi:hypothetical protein